MANNTQSLILRRSMELFREKGFNNVTINDICSECSITKSAFYYHYKSKEDLIAGFYKDVNLFTPEKLAKVFSADSPWKQIWQLYEIYIDYTVSSGVGILSELFRMSIAKNEKYFINATSTEIYLPLIKKAQASDEIRNQSSPEELFDNASRLIIAIAFDWCINNGSYDEKEAIKKALEVNFDVNPKLRT